MSWRSTFLLVLLVAVLGAAAWWQTRRETSYVDGTTERLFDGVELSRIRSIRLEALERPPGTRFERDSRGEWFITDPIAYPARQAMMEELLGIVRRNMAQPATQAEIASRDEEFERLGILDVEEELEDGSRRVTRIEVGDVDLDGMRLWVRKDGRILRTMRNIETMLERELHELRADRIFSIDPAELVSFARTGVDLRSGAVSIIDVEARRDVYAWRLVKPYRAQLDPSTWMLYLSSLTALKIDEFVDDNAKALGPYGLDAPQVSLLFEDRFGQVQEAQFAQAIDSGVWYAHREGMPYVWQLEEGAAARFFEHPELFLDEQLVRVFRDDVQVVEIVGHAGVLRLERDRKSNEPRWLLSTRDDSGETMSRPADRALVEALLATVERAQLRHLLDVDPTTAFPEDAPREGVWIEDVRGVRQGGRIGVAHAWEDGTKGRLYLRDAEDVVGFVDNEVGALLELRASDLLSRRVVEIDEVVQRRMVLTSGDRSRVYVRSTEGVWRHESSGLEAKELRELLDAIFFLRASEHLPRAASTEPLAEAVRIELLDARGNTVVVTIGKDAEGRAVAETLGQRSLLADTSLHEKLLALFAP